MKNDCLKWMQPAFITLGNLPRMLAVTYGTSNIETFLKSNIKYYFFYKNKKHRRNGARV